MLNDKRHILTKDTDNNVAIYDVLKVEKNQDLGPVDFDAELQQRNQKVYIPNWFTVDLKTGVSWCVEKNQPEYRKISCIILFHCPQMPTIVLGQDEVDCFAAWVSAEAGLPEHRDIGSDLKVCNRMELDKILGWEMWFYKFNSQINYGSLLLQALLEQWPQTHTHASNEEVIKGNEYFTVPKHTPVIFR